MKKSNNFNNGKIDSEYGVSFNTQFKKEAAIALIKFTKDMRLLNEQDTIRIAVSSFLIKNGYLKKKNQDEK